MNKLLDQQIHELLTNSEARAMLECERALRVGAATLARGPWGQITATTVVCDLADGQIDALESLVADIAEEYGLEASIQQHPGSCCVRFSWPRPSEPAPSMPSEKSLLARLLGR